MTLADIYQESFIVELEKIAADKDFAPGLPSKTKFDPITHKGLSRLVVQQHKATSDHYDMRLQEGDMAHSWVIRSLPGEKNKMLALRQPTHRVEYMDFEGNIEKGYGAGSVKKVLDIPVDVISSSDKKINLAFPDSEITMIKTNYSPDSWLMINRKPFEKAVSSKPKYKVIAEPADFSDDTKVLQPKIDGAHTIFHLKSDDINRIYSYRNSKKNDKPIDYSHKMPEIRDLEIPDELDDTILRGEVYATKGNKPVPAEQISGLLNAAVPKSIEKQNRIGKLKPYIFDVVRYGGENVEEKPYAEKLKIIREIASKIPELPPPETAETAEEKRILLDLIKKKRHPDTKEGVVEWDLKSPTGDPKKFKFRNEHDVVIREIFPAVEQKTGIDKDEAGGFRYSWTPKGKIVGSVGTGFTREKRKDLLKHPEDYIGRIARVKTQEIFESGAMRAPSFSTLDIEKNL